MSAPRNIARERASRRARFHALGKDNSVRRLKSRGHQPPVDLDEDNDVRAVGDALLDGCKSADQVALATGLTPEAVQDVFDAWLVRRERANA